MAKGGTDRTGGVGGPKGPEHLAYMEELEKKLGTRKPRDIEKKTDKAAQKRFSDKRKFERKKEIAELKMGKGKGKVKRTTKELEQQRREKSQKPKDHSLKSTIVKDRPVAAAAAAKAHRPKIKGSPENLKAINLRVKKVLAENKFTIPSIMNNFRIVGAAAAAHGFVLEKLGLAILNAKPKTPEAVRETLSSDKMLQALDKHLIEQDITGGDLKTAKGQIKNWIERSGGLGKYIQAMLDNIE